MALHVWVLLGAVAFFAVSLIATFVSRCLGGKRKDAGDLPPIERKKR